MRILQDKSFEELCREWDLLAPIRLRQITSGVDLSFTHVITPAVLHLVEREQPESLIDAGCGIGALTSQLKLQVPKVIGIDPSKVSIEIAQSNYGKTIGFYHERLETFARHYTERFNMVVANMVLMNVPDLGAFLAAAASLIKPKGTLIFSVTHPWFWPKYYKYDTKPWYNYKRELMIESSFRITLEPETAFVSTHFHRPLEMYMANFASANFKLELLLEPLPNEETADRYGGQWDHPRFLIGRCRASE